MSKEYDPMTGELIKDDVTQKQFWWESEDAEQKNHVEESSTAEEAAPEVPKLAADTVQDMNFNPMTGEPIPARQMESNTFQPETDMNFDPMTGKPLVKGNSKNKKLLKKILIPICIVAAVLAFLFVGMISGLFLSKNDKILVAVKNTIKPNHIVQDLDIRDIISGKAYCVEVSSKIDDLEFDAAYSSDRERKTLNLDSDTIAVKADMGKDTVAVQMPAVDDVIYEYHYREEKSGAIRKLVGSGNLEEIDDALVTFFDGNQQEDFIKDIGKISVSHFRQLEFESVNTKNCKVNGDTRKCKGYQATVTSDELVDYVDAISDMCDEKYTTISDLLQESGMSFRELRKELRKISDIELTVYLYKKQVAEIHFETDDSSVEIKFTGGDSPAQNLEISVSDDYEDYVLLEVKGSIKNKTEKTKIIVDEYEEIIITYDYDKGKYTLETEDSYASGVLKRSSGKLELTVEEMSNYGMDLDGEIQVTIEKGANFTKLEGEKIDVGEASKKELEDIMEKVAEYYYY